MSIHEAIKQQDEAREQEAREELREVEYYINKYGLDNDTKQV